MIKDSPLILDDRSVDRQMFVHKVIISVQRQLNILLLDLVIHWVTNIQRWGTFLVFQVSFSLCLKRMPRCIPQSYDFLASFWFNSFLLMDNLLPKIIFNSLLGYILTFSLNLINENPLKSLDICLRIKNRGYVCTKKSAGKEFESSPEDSLRWSRQRCHVLYKTWNKVKLCQMTGKEEILKMEHVEIIQHVPKFKFQAARLWLN